eukprot:Colp12_sorted_trinity150504_noHs@1224
MAYLTAKQLDGLKKHKYSSSSASPFDKYVMTPFWNWLVSLIPLWLAPNVITFFGLLVNIFTTLALAYYSPHATEEAPAWRTWAVLSVSLCTSLWMQSMENRHVEPVVAALLASYSTTDATLLAQLSFSSAHAFLCSMVHGGCLL